MSDENKPLKYAHIIGDVVRCEVKLSREQQDAVLMAYDYGTEALSAEQKLALGCVIADLKLAIWR